jgi:hypothetical protein
MTPKEKAKELYDKFYMAIPNDEMGLNDEASRQCALIAVDEILKLENPNTYNYLTESKEHLIVQIADNYWQEVKKEIENL